MVTLKIFWKLFPFLLVLAVYLALITGISIPLPPLIVWLPYILGVMFASVSLFFNRTRLVLAALSVLLTYGLIREGLQASLNQSAVYMLFLGANALYVLNIILCAVYRERGWLSLWSLSRLLLVLVPYLLLLSPVSQGSMASLHQIIKPWLSPITTEHYWVSNFWLWLHMGGGLLVIAIAIFKRTSIEAGLALVWLTGVFIFYDFSKPQISSVLVSVLFVALFISLLQSAYDLAFVDALTTLPGRRALEEKMGTLGKLYSIAMLDVDHFKKFNDTWGHDVGDQVLKLVASRISRVGEGGKAYRYGGEEFTIVFPGRNKGSLLYELEELRESVASYPIVLRGKDRAKSAKQGMKRRRVRKTNQSVHTNRKKRQKDQEQVSTMGFRQLLTKKSQNKDTNQAVHITISIGVADNRQKKSSVAQVIKAADKALYRAKEGGRNKVSV